MRKCTIISGPSPDVLERIQRSEAQKRRAKTRRAKIVRREARRSSARREAVVAVESAVSRKGTEGYSVIYCHDGGRREVFYLEATLPSEAARFLAKTFATA